MWINLQHRVASVRIGCAAGLEPVIYTMTTCPTLEYLSFDPIELNLKTSTDWPKNGCTMKFTSRGTISRIQFKGPNPDTVYIIPICENAAGHNMFAS